jgi:quinol monooxygenase YgiN
MERIGILATVTAKPGRADDVEAFLKSAQLLAQSEAQTLQWYAFKFDDSRFGIFDTFADHDGRRAHVSGEIARQLVAAAVELFAAPPSIEFVEIVANKHSA